MVTYLSERTGNKKPQINIISGFTEPADMRELKRIATDMGIKTVVFPDTSDVLDTPQTGKHRFYPAGGVTVNALRSTGDSLASIALGRAASAAAARALDSKCKVPCEILNLPIGLQATDAFVDALRKISGMSVPDKINDERGRLLDIITDMHQYFYGKKVALFGDPDQLISLTRFLIDLDMKPVHVLTGTPDAKFEERIRKITGSSVPTANVLAGGDLYRFHQWIKNEPVDLLIGNTYGKYIARDEDIPFIRFGFPILDRIGHSYFPSVGYSGGMQLLQKILNALMDRQDRDSAEHQVELVM